MSADKKVLLITGGNTGLGFEAVKALYKTDLAYELIIGCRTISKGEAAIDSLTKEVASSPSTLSVLQVDLESDESISKAIQQIEQKFNRLDILINNGGADFDLELQSGKMTIRQAWNTSWDVNVSGAQVLTTAAVPLLLKSSEPRLMFVSSGTSSITGSENLSNPASQRINGSPPAGWPKPEQVNPIESYRSSKTGLNMMMRQWHRILLNDGVKVWAISPGVLATGLGGMGREQMSKVSTNKTVPYLPTRLY
jgi:NAD(P)-dependent dehydrogenase (short-subunit alcohol dehydrogenase family)